MWSLPLPRPVAADTFAACVAQVSSRDLQEKYAAAKSEIMSANESFLEAARRSSWHELEEEDLKTKLVSSEEMTKLYNGQLRRLNTPARAIYDEIKNARELCPLCNQRAVETLDHYLAKSKFPALAVSPPNLIPACSDCNKLKLSSVAEAAEQQTLHPYFDYIEEDPWLQAEVRETNPPSVRFFVAPPESWTRTLTERANTHFRMFKLGRLYRIHAGEEISIIRHDLQRIFDREGSKGVQVSLARSAESRRNARVNSWQTAAYTALRDSTWFCERGFALRG
ncbi:hypothetical protein AB0F95_17005 [Micromonospora tulbaghiae]|uniref:HNH endonuclease n=1 Tax=Micromonospora tulbaghiae TaxID=479978 RepID=UPI003402E504